MIHHKQLQRAIASEKHESEPDGSATLDQCRRLEHKGFFLLTCTRCAGSTYIYLLQIEGSYPPTCMAGRPVLIQNSTKIAM